MRDKNSGFTLIELMTVVAIIGILALIMLGSYTIYTKRTYVSEGLIISESARIAIADYYMANASFPSNNDVAGISAPNAFSTKVVKSVEILDDGTGKSEIEITFTNVVIEDETIVYEPLVSDTGIVWDCTGGTLGNLYRPPVCR